jgi:hypothetical protein
MTASQRQQHNAMFAAAVSEAELDRTVRDLTAWIGVRCFSIRNSRAGIVTSRGYPDLTLVGAGGIAFRELKKQSGSRPPTSWHGATR